MAHELTRIITPFSGSVTANAAGILIDKWNLPAGGTCKAITLLFNGALSNDTASPISVTSKQLLMSINEQLNLTPPVNRQIVKGDGRLLFWLGFMASGSMSASGMGLPAGNVWTVPAASNSVPGTAAYMVGLTIPFSFATARRNRDFNLPCTFLQSLQVQMAGVINGCTNSATLTVDCYCNTSPTVAQPAVYQAQMLPESADSVDLSGKVIALTSFPPVGKNTSDYPQMDYTVNSTFLYTRTNPGQPIQAALFGSRSPNAIEINWTGEDVIMPIQCPTPGFSLLDVARNSYHLQYRSSLTTALSGADTVGVLEILDYAKAAGTVVTASQGKQLRGKHENLPVVAG